VVFGALGLSEEETHVYTTLVRYGSYGVERLPELLGIPPERVQRALKVLVAQDLVTLEDSDPPQAIAAPPDIAGEMLMSQRMHELLTARAAMTRLTEEYRTRARARRVDQVPIEFTPQAAVPQRIDQIQRTAREEVLIFDTPPYSETFNERQVEQLAHGVCYRTVYSREAIETPGGLEQIDIWVAAGEQARVSGRLPMKLMIVDRALALLPSADATATHVGGFVLVHPCPLLVGLIDLFERVWADALPLDALVQGTRTPRSMDLDETELQVLTLLLSGLTDEVIARQLGVGRRTVLRRVRSLMDRAGVETRVQLGWYAARRGWIDLAAGGPGPVPGPLGTDAGRGGSGADQGASGLAFR
jgi:predicted transcriptional regulator